MVGLHEFLVDGGALARRQVGSGWVVGFVGAVWCFVNRGGERVCLRLGVLARTWLWFRLRSGLGRCRPSCYSLARHRPMRNWESALFCRAGSLSVETGLVCSRTLLVQQKVSRLGLCGPEEEIVTRESTNRNRRDVGEPSIDLIATDDVPITRVCDVGVFIVEVAPVHLGFGIVKKPTLAWPSSWRLGRVLVAAWECTSCIERVRGRCFLRGELEGCRNRVHACQGDTQRQKKAEHVHCL